MKISNITEIKKLQFCKMQKRAFLDLSCQEHEKALRKSARQFFDKNANLIEINKAILSGTLVATLRQRAATEGVRLNDKYITGLYDMWIEAWRDGYQHRFLSASGQRAPPKRIGGQQEQSFDMREHDIHRLQYIFICLPSCLQFPMMQAKARKTTLLLCNSCYWISSLLDSAKRIPNCPLCNTTLESLPVENNECCTIEAAGTKTGLIIEFQRA